MVVLQQPVELLTVGAQTTQLAIIGAAAAVLGLLVYRGASKAGQALGQAGAAVADTARAAAGAVDTGIAAPVYLLGDAVGMPRTSANECDRAKREGRTWDASFACPAGEWLRYVVAPPVVSPANPAADQSGGGLDWAGGAWQWGP